MKNQTFVLPTVFLLIIFPLSLATTEDDVKCLKGIKNTLKDPQQSLNSWNFSNSSDHKGFICKFAGASCWNDKENRLISLQLKNFQLYGNIPDSVQFCSSIQNLDLSGNSFSGSIPAKICSWLPFLATLNLSNNSLSGHIPPDLSDCNYLNTLILSHNSLSGTLPRQLSSLKRLSVFSVAHNELSGQIPASFARFDESSFEGNDGLCGKPIGSKCGGLSKRNLAIIVAAAVFGAVASLLLQLGFCWWRRSSLRQKS